LRLTKFPAAQTELIVEYFSEALSVEGGMNSAQALTREFDDVPIRRTRVDTTWRPLLIRQEEGAHD
jgi:hypothetical protein